MAKITKRQKKFAASGGLKSTIKKRRQVKQQRPKPKEARPKKAPSGKGEQKDKTAQKGAEFDVEGMDVEAFFDEDNTDDDAESETLRQHLKKMIKDAGNPVANEGGDLEEDDQDENSQDDGAEDFPEDMNDGEHDDEEGDVDESMDDADAKHRKELEGLEEADPQFYKFLKQQGQEGSDLLAGQEMETDDFMDDDDDDDDDEDTGDQPLDGKRIILLPPFVLYPISPAFFSRPPLISSHSLALSFLTTPLSCLSLFISFLLGHFLLSRYVSLAWYASCLQPPRLPSNFMSPFPKRGQRR